MRLNDLIQEQIEISVKLNSNVDTVYDLSYLLIDFQAMVNGFTEFVNEINSSYIWQEDFMEDLNGIFYQEDKRDGYFLNNKDHPDWQKKIEMGLRSMVFPEIDKIAAKPTNRYKKTAGRNFNKKYKSNLILKDFKKGCLFLDIASSVLVGLIIEFIKELVSKKVDKKEIMEVNIKNSTICINGQDIKFIPKNNSSQNKITNNEGSNSVSVNTKEIIEDIISSVKPDEDIEESVKRLLVELKNRGMIEQSEIYDKKGMKTFIRDTDRFIGSLIDYTV